MHKPVHVTYQNGLNSLMSLGAMAPGSLPICDNFRQKGMSLASRTPAVKIATIPAVSTQALYYYNTATIGTEFMVAVASATVYAFQNTGGAPSWANITGAGLGAGDGFVFDVLNGYLILGTANGVYTWQGTGVMTFQAGWGLASLISTIKVVNNFLFVCYIDNPISTVYWSNVSDPTTPSGVSVDFRKGDGDYLTALSSLGSDLIIFKRFSIGRLSTQTTMVSGSITLGPLTTVCEGIGCAGPKAVDHLPDGRLIFLSSNLHAYIFDGNIPVDISDQAFPQSNVQSLFDACVLAGRSGLNVTVTTFSDQHETWFQINGCNILIYDYINNTWSRKPVTTVTAMAFVKSEYLGFWATSGTGVPNEATLTALVTASGTGLFQENVAAGTDYGGAGAPYDLKISVPIPADSVEHNPRSVVIPIQTLTASSVTYKQNASGSTTFTTTGNTDRLQIKLDTVRPITSQVVEIQGTTAITIDPGWMSESIVG